jgi:dipeptidyl aminopeptidase/acylaminoacyl peptidase
MARPRHVFAAIVVLVSIVAPLACDASTWRQPPQEVLDVLKAPDLPASRLSPTGDVLALLSFNRYPPIEDLAQPMLALAGVRIDTRTNGRHAAMHFTGITLRGVADGRERRVSLPANAKVTEFDWSADGKRFAFLNQVADGIELWIGETASGEVRRVPDLEVNPTLFWSLTWMPDQRTLLVKRIPPDRGPAPEAPLTPDGPDVQETERGGAASTYEARDVLTCPFDETCFEHYALSQLALVDCESGRVTPVGEPGIIALVAPSPDGKLILTERLHKPWSYRAAWYRFPRDVEVIDLKGSVRYTLAHLPLTDHVPIHGVAEGPREYSWRQSAPATLVWMEALDGGDPGRKSDHRDRVMMLASPFERPAAELYKAKHRVTWIAWGERQGLVLIQEFERERRWRYMWALNADAGKPAARLLFDLSVNERYKNPGDPVIRERPDGEWVLAQDGDALFLSGDGASPEGDRPFLDRFSLRTRAAERLFRCDRTSYEFFVGLLDTWGKGFLTRRESPNDPPNYVVHTLTKRLEKPSEDGEAQWLTEMRPATSFADPTPQIRGVTKRIVEYKRADGTDLSFTLYLPPGYKEGTRLPAVFEAYPLEYSDPGTAGQVSGTDRNFTRFLGPTPLFFLLEGYAVLENVAMPVIGDPDTAYDTFIEQLTADAKAAIDKAVEIGVSDRDQVGIIGHSHGALMVATLLAHTDLFRAGIARSGAYNHTLRPFGFQSERRTLWQAKDTYLKMSPLLYADKINEPILLIHGEEDQNPGTVPLQSRKLFEAISGTGGTARLVMLPHESHGYQAIESVEEVLADQIDWFNRYVKEMPPVKSE